MQLLLATAPRFVNTNGAVTTLPLRDAALLAWLALEGPTPRLRVAQLLWPDSDPAAARNALRQRLFTLRKTLGTEIIAGTAILALAAGVTHDLADADSVLGAAEAVPAGEFTAWLEQQRARRRDRARQALTDLAQAAEDSQDWTQALIHARELLALGPPSEAAHRRLMRLHYLAGDRAGALLAFERCEQMLRRDLGAGPSAQTLALLTTIRQSTALVMPAPRATLPASVPAAVLRPPRLIGRDAAWRTLHEAWEAGRNGVVIGEAGMGKSRLVGDFAHARGCTLVVSARPGDERVVYSSLSRLLRALPAAAVHALDAPLRRTLAWLLPELGDAPALPGREGRVRFFNAVSALLDHDALALDAFVFDDLHFADEASIELLRYVVAASRRRWLVTARPGEVSAPARGLLDDWLAQPEAVQVTLAPLTLEEVADVVDSLGLAFLNGAASAATLLRHSGGNPLYLLETLKAWLATGGDAAGLAGADASGNAPWPARLPVTSGLRALIERRIGRLSDDAVRLARCAAVAAPDFSIELASHVLGVRTLDIVDAWNELEQAQIFRDSAFAHDLIYESALASVPAAVAAQLHAEIAEFLQTRDAEPARLAQHWARAQRWARAGPAFLAAAQRSRDASRPAEQCALLAEAALCFENAGQPEERFDALLQRARALAADDLGTDASDAVQALDDAAHTDEQRLLALGARFELAVMRGEIDDALRLGPSAIAHAHALARPDLELRFAILYSGALCDVRRAEEAVALLEPHATWAREHAGTEQHWEYWHAHALALDYANRLRDALPAWDAALAVAQRAGRRDLLWKTMANAASTQAKMGMVREAAQATEKAHRLARACGDALTIRMLQMQVTAAHRLRDVGRYGEALVLLEEALAGFATGGGSQADLARTEQCLVVLYQHLGQPARAVPLLAAERPGMPRGLAMIRLAHRAELEARMGRDGLLLMREALQIIPNADDIYHRITSLFASRLVQPDEGEALAAGLALWATTRERYGVALAGHVRAAACALAQGTPARAFPHVDAALHLAKRYLPDSFYLAELWVVAAQTLEPLGRDDDARRAAAEGLAWMKNVHDAQVPGEFRASFLERNPVNRELLALNARMRHVDPLSPPGG